MKFVYQLWVKHKYHRIGGTWEMVGFYDTQEEADRYRAYFTNQNDTDEVRVILQTEYTGKPDIQTTKGDNIFVPPLYPDGKSR